MAQSMMDHTWTARHVICMMWFVSVGSIAEISAQEKRTFPEADCSYTLPGPEWSWLDPAGFQNNGELTVVAFAENGQGLGIVISYTPTKALLTQIKTVFESFESGLLKSGRTKKLSGKHDVFQSAPSYEIEFEKSEGQIHGSVRVVLAHERLYQLMIANNNPSKNIVQDYKSIFQGFEFTSPPARVPPVNSNTSRNPMEDPNFVAGRMAAPLFDCSIVALVFGGIGGLIYLVAKQNSPTQDRDRRRRD